MHLGEHEQFPRLGHDPARHHQVVLATGRDPASRKSTINQLSFTVRSLDELRTMHRRVKDYGVEHLRGLNHGNAWSIYFDDPDSWFQKASAAEQQALRDLDVQVLLPLSGRDELLGVMALGPKRSEEPCSKADLRLLQSVASQTGLAIENGRLLLTLADEAARRERLHRELEIAREV